jgi:hypothetical protein
LNVRINLGIKSNISNVGGRDNPVSLRAPHEVYSIFYFRRVNDSDCLPTKLPERPGEFI